MIVSIHYNPRADSAGACNTFILKADMLGLQLGTASSAEKRFFEVNGTEKRPPSSCYFSERSIMEKWRLVVQHVL